MSLLFNIISRMTMWFVQKHANKRFNLSRQSYDISRINIVPGELLRAPFVIDSLRNISRSFAYNVKIFKLFVEKGERL